MKKFKRVIAALLIAIMAFAFSGCAQMISEVTINEDGSGKLTITIGILNSFIEQMNATGSMGTKTASTTDEVPMVGMFVGSATPEEVEDPDAVGMDIAGAENLENGEEDYSLGDFSFSVDDMLAGFKQSYEEAGFTTEDYAGEEYTGFKAYYDIPDVNNFKGNEIFDSVTMIADGKNYSFSMPSQTLNGSMEESGIDLDSMAAMGKVDFRVVITMPFEVTENNGTSLSDDKKSVTWDLTKFTGDSLEVKAVKSTNIVLIVGIIAAVVIVIAVVVIIIVKGKKKPAEAIENEEITEGFETADAAPETPETSEAPEAPTEQTEE